MAGARIDQAGRDFAREGVIQTRLVTANAGVDFVGAAFARFDHELRIGEERTRHRDHVAGAVGEQLLGQLGRIDAIGRDQRDTDFAHQTLSYPSERAARNGGGDGRDARFVPADAGIENGGAGFFDGLRQLHHFVKSGATFDQIEHG